MGHSTCRQAIIEVCRVLYFVLAPEYLKLPSTPEQWRQISVEFDRQWDFPHCIGALDGKHVRIACPDNSGSEYINYKGYFSIVLMAMCDARYVLWIRKKFGARLTVLHPLQLSIYRHRCWRVRKRGRSGNFCVLHASDSAKQWATRLAEPRTTSNVRQSDPLRHRWGWGVPSQTQYYAAIPGKKRWCFGFEEKDL